MTIEFKNITLDSLKEIAQILSKKLTPGTTVCLWGDLGVGKTTFSRLLIQSLNPNVTDVPSPTFTLVQTYDTSQGNLWHCDLYRLKSPQEILELGLEEAIYESILLIEWPQKMGVYLPHDRLDCMFSFSKTMPLQNPEEEDFSPPETRTLKFILRGECEIDLQDFTSFQKETFPAPQIGNL